MPTENRTRLRLPALTRLLLAGAASVFAITAANAQTVVQATATQDPAANAAAPGGNFGDTSSTFALRTGDTATATDDTAPAMTTPAPARTAAAAGTTTAATPDPDTFGRMNFREPADNTRTGSIDNLRPRREDIDAPGVRVGSFIIRPSIGEGIGVESTKYGSTTTTRSFLQTTGKADIMSDWSLHQLSISATGVWQTNIGGSGATKPTASVDSKLRLDVDRLTIANLTAGYSFARESSTDPNSIVGASTQSGIHTFKGGADVTREFGKFRGTVAGTVTRNVYTAATLADGSLMSMSDRNQTTVGGRVRLGYEISPALIPFVEGSIDRAISDQTLDRNGYNRNANIYAAKAGVQLDFTEKLRGEIAAGYKQVRYTDARLSKIDAFTVDGKIDWSPIRGTDVNLTLATGVDPSTTAGVSGSTYYTISTAVSQQMIDNLVGTVGAGTTFRHFSPNGIASDQTEWAATAGLNWSLSRYLELAGTVAWNYTDVKTGTDTRSWSAIAELRVKR
ncbi:outer membrane beta-barrel protein [Rhizobium sp. C4]|uniref:outer membrane beta-barrel protein n=1 Tax=Rhizobium sp. C4 TaxID=1349800 RepID=UPI001E45B50A|nr:outer membrane beta-barrel protein [Rhizobium sp. C4]MCD2174074.1 outer membrane beta-barrel protein [Rhizobium sp. C4]